MIISNRLSKNSSNEEVFNESKEEYENALKQSGYNNINLKYQSLVTSNTTQKCRRNICLIHHSAAMSPPMFLQLLGKHFPPSNSFHKIFNRNTIKVSYCCTQNLGSIIKSHNKKLISSNNRIILPRHCRRKEQCPLEEKCRADDAVYKCIASANCSANKV